MQFSNIALGSPWRVYVDIVPDVADLYLKKNNNPRFPVWTALNIHLRQTRLLTLSLVWYYIIALSVPGQNLHPEIE